MNGYACSTQTNGLDWKKELELFLRLNPKYLVVDTPNEDNGYLFVVQVFVEDVIAADADGATQEEAEQTAAKRAYEYAKRYGPRKALLAFKVKATTFERGERTEDRVVRVLRSLCKRRPRDFPGWFQGIDWATHEQDTRERTDAVVTTLGLPGRLRLQIKSSSRGAMEARRKHPDDRIAIVSVSYYDEDQKIAKKVIRSLDSLRRWYIGESVADR